MAALPSDAGARYVALDARTRANPAVAAPLLGGAIKAEAARRSSCELRDDLSRVVFEDLANDETCARWGPAVVLLALELVKTLARDSYGTQALAEPANVRTLAAHAQLLDIPPPGFSPNSPALSTASSQIHRMADNELEALRCFVNLLRLQDAARTSLAALPGALEAIINLSKDPTPPAGQFLGGRLLMLLTVSGGELNRVLVDEHRLGDILVETLNAFPLPPAAAVKSRSDTAFVPASSEQLAALTEHLRVVYNLARFYPQLVTVAAAEQRVREQRERERAASPAPSTVVDEASSNRMMRSVSDDAASIRSNTRLVGGQRRGSVDRDRAATSSGAILASASSSVHRKVKGLFSRSPRLGVDSSPESPNGTRRRRWRSTDGEAVSEPGLSSRLMPACARLLVGLPAEADDTPTTPLHAVINAMTVLSGHASLVSTASSVYVHPLPALPKTGLQSTPTPLPPVPSRLLALLDAVTRVYCSLPGEPTVSPDDPRLVRKRGEEEDRIDALIVSFSGILCEIIHLDDSGVVELGLRSRLLASDMLMSSVYMASARVMVPKLLFTICESDASIMSAKLGFGNCAGFFAANSLPFAPDQNSIVELGADGREVDPITGAYRHAAASTDPPPMTDEEMEREAEKMFTLFDRMNRTGVIKVENPMQAAQQSGRFEEIGAKEAAAQADEEDEEERQALAEFAKYKARKQRAAA